MAAPPTPPTSPVAYAALYQNLQAIVKTFVQYYFTPAVYKGTFFAGTLTATLFAGVYTLPKSQGGGTYAFQLNVPGPETGAGISFMIAALVLAVFYLGRRHIKTV